MKWWDQMPEHFNSQTRAFSLRGPSLISSFWGLRTTKFSKWEKAPMWKAHLSYQIYACVQLLSHVCLSAVAWTIAHQTPLPLEFSRQEYWSGLSFPTSGDLPDLRVELCLLHWQAHSLPLEPPRKLWLLRIPMVNNTCQLKVLARNNFFFLILILLEHSWFTVWKDACSFLCLHPRWTFLAINEWSPN